MKYKTLQYLIAATAVLLLLTVCGIPVRAQSLDPFNPYSSIAPAAETYAMVRHGGLTPSLYSGAMSYSVPVFTYQDPDFTIPVSLDYNFDGYKPAQYSGTVGYGWALNCGGVITREIRGLPDDDYVYGVDDRPNLGYYWTANSWHSSVSRALNDSTRWGTVCNTATLVPVTVFSARKIDPYAHIPLHSTKDTNNFWNHNIIESMAYDMTPDIYHFSFFGHSGDFMLLPDGSVRVFNSDLPHGEIKVEFLPPNAIRWPSEVLAPEFAITTGDGTRYLFGGYYDDIEYVRSSTAEIPNLYSWSAVAFRLKQIEAPNGRSVTLTYSHLKQTSLLSQIRYTPKYDGDDSNEVSETRHQFTRTYYPILTSVLVNGVERIHFRYEDKDQNEDAAAYFDSFSPVSTGIPLGIYPASGAVRLSGIELLDDAGIVVQQAALTQSYASNGTPKMFLSSVTTTKGGMHTFTYDQAFSFPKNDTASTDHWGYWNGYSGYCFDPRTDVIPNAGRFVQMNPSCTKKDPDPSRSALGGLTRITYPTGGTTDIGYEGNEVEKGLDENGFLYEPLTGAFAVGGVRVCRLIDSISPTAVPDSTLFHYSEGFLYYMPRYAFRFPIYYHSDNQSDLISLHYFVTGYNGDVDYTVSGDCPVGYRSVTQTHPDRSSTKTVFCTYLDVPDEFTWDENGGFVAFPQITKRNVIYPHDYIQCDEGVGTPNTICASVDCRNMRGRPLSISVRDSAGTLLRKTEYEYVADTVSLNWIYMNNIESFLAMPWKSLSAMQSSEKVTDYLDSGSLVKTRILDYNDAGQVACETAWSPQLAGDTLRTHFRYLHEAGLAASPDALPGALYMAARTRTSGGIRYLLDGVRYTYACADVHIKPRCVERFRSEAPSPLPNPVSWAEAVTALPVDGTLQFGYDPGTYFPISVQMPGDAWESYAWTGLYPAVKRVNGYVNSFIYTWQDQVGLKTLTAPSGAAETYDYDTRARLRLVKDPDGAPVTLYDYQLSNDQ